MQPNRAEFEHSMLRMGSVAFLAGVIITIVSTLFHATSEDLTDHPVVFAAYAQSDPWIAAHIGQFAGVMLIFAGGFVALFRLLVLSESSAASALAWLGFAVTIAAASTFAILQAVDGIALKRAVDSWYTTTTTTTTTEEKAIAFRVAEGIRWIEIGINSINRIIQGAVAIIFGVAIAKSALLSRWIGAVGIFAGAATIIAGVGVAYVGFAPMPIVGDMATIASFTWAVILGIFMWRKTMVKVITR
ncbi:MAG TPA: DUF4386 family protein [Nitrososphaera sp.]